MAKQKQTSGSLFASCDTQLDADLCKAVFQLGDTSVANLTKHFDKNFYPVSASEQLASIDRLTADGRIKSYMKSTNGNRSYTAHVYPAAMIVDQVTVKPKAEDEITPAMNQAQPTIPGPLEQLGRMLDQYLAAFNACNAQALPSMEVKASDSPEKPTTLSVEKVLRAIKSGGSDGVTRTSIRPKTQFMPSAERDAAIESLKALGKIVEQIVRIPGRKAATLYIAT